MTLLRDEKQAALAEINDWGNSLLLRYRELADIDPGLRTVLQDIIGDRQELLLQVAACALARNDLPTAEDQDMTQLKSLTDKLVDYIVGSEAMISRVLDAELSWHNRLKELESLSWNPTERTLIEQLEKDAESFILRLREMEGNR